MIYLVLFWTFLKVGAFTFGGGYAMLPLIEDEVISHGWLTEQEIVNFIAVSESTPGPICCKHFDVRRHAGRRSFRCFLRNARRCDTGFCGNTCYCKIL